MSLILDALRGRSVRAAMPRPNPNPAQTDAVLHTLGYRRRAPSLKRLNRVEHLLLLGRLVGYLAIGIVLGFVIWGAVVWITSHMIYA